MKLIISPHLFKDYGRKSFTLGFFSKILIVFLLLTLSGTELVAQVVIKERVKIEPNTTHSKIQSTTLAYTPCGPWISSYDLDNRWQVVWRYSQYDLVVQHQPFNYQENTYGSANTHSFTIEIIEGNTLCELLELVPDPTIENGYYYQTAPDILENVSLGDAGGVDTFWTEIQGVPSVHHVAFVRYTIHFTGIGDVTYKITENGETIFYHTKIVEPDFYIDYDTVYVHHGEYAEIYYKPKPI